jgi:Type IX secretion system protein PorV
MTKINLSVMVFLFCAAAGFSVAVYGQQPGISGEDTTSLRPVTTAVPFAAFTPDARSAALGDAGGALGPDANSVYWGAAKLAQSSKNYGVAVSYAPWLRNIVDDMYFTYLSGFTKIGKNQAVGASLMYFDHGKFEARNNQGNSLGDFYSNESLVSLAYSRKLSDKFSVGLNLKYINSNLTGSYIGTGTAMKPGQTVAGDISAFYQGGEIDEATGKGWKTAGALLIQNIGGKVNYGGTETGFIPTNLKLSGAATRHIDTHNKLTFILDFNKLMVPTPPVRDANRNITRGKDPNRGTFAAMFGSFADAPDGFGEELREFTISTGAEYWYNEAFAVRAGYFNEANSKGGRKYFTIGFGARVQNRYGIDFAYLMPQSQGSALANSFRVSLVVDMFKKQVEEDTTPEETTEQ